MLHVSIKKLSNVSVNCESVFWEICAYLGSSLCLYCQSLSFSTGLAWACGFCCWTGTRSWEKQTGHFDCEVPCSGLWRRMMRSVSDFTTFVTVRGSLQCRACCMTHTASISRYVCSRIPLVYNNWAPFAGFCLFLLLMTRGKFFFGGHNCLFL